MPYNYLCRFSDQKNMRNSNKYRLKSLDLKKIKNKYIFPRQFAEANSAMCLPTGGPK